jgi:4-hydroxy-tetrahydrodipicolinate reductase
MKIALFGYGKMGKLIEKLAVEHNHQIVFKSLTNPSSKILQSIDEADVCIDFSHPHCIIDHLKICITKNKPLIIGTTGWDASFNEVKKLIDNSTIGCLYSPNFSIGVYFFNKIATYATSLLSNEYDCAMLEFHHNKKVDSPSGTSLFLKQNLDPLLEAPLAISSVRCGSMPGTHEIYFDSPYDTIKLSHEARHRDGFAYGAIRAAEWIIGKQGLFTMEDIYSCR